MSSPHTGAAGAGTPGARWHLCLLGGVRLQGHTTEHTRFATRAIAALLARLALAPDRDHPREELVELLWPDADPGTGRRRLRQALSLLRAVLEPPDEHPWPVLQADRRSVRVLPGVISCDVHSFEAQLRCGQHDAALASYRGDFMPGFFDEWIHDERMRLCALHDRLTAANAHSASLGARGAPLQAPTVTPALPAPPALPARRAPPAVPSTAMAFARTRSGAPAYLTRYFADPQQCARLAEQVLAHRLVNLLGPGGSGKTRLAVHLVELWSAPGGPHAAVLPAAPFDLVQFVPLAAVQTREQLLDALQAALQISAAPSTVDNLVARLEGVPALLVLDNLEQLVDVAGSVLDPLVATLPQLHLLVTSRRRSGLDGERAFQIEPLATPPSGTPLSAAASSPSVALFVDRARAARGDFHLSGSNHAAIVDLVGCLEGMPLAIELAASRIRAFTPGDMLARLRPAAGAPGKTPGLDLLSRPDLRPTLRSRHASMQRAIAWSWAQLRPEQQSLAAAMAVFPGGCDAAMLAAVHGGDAVAEGLEQLHAHSLIRAQPGAPDAADALRFQLYVPIREFAAAQFDQAQSAAWRARQRGWALAWLQTLPATPPLARVRAELANLSAAVSSAAADAAGHDVAGFLQALQPLHEGITLSTELLGHAGAALAACADAALRSRGCSALAPWLLTAGNMPEARRLAEAGVTDAPPRSAVRGWALHALAHVHWRGALSSAAVVQPWLDEALSTAEACGDAELLGSVLTLMSMVRWAHDHDADAAHALAARAEQEWAAHGNRHGVLLALHNVAVVAFRAGRRQQALSCWEAIAAEAAELQDTRRLAITQSARTTALGDMRRWAEARQAVRVSLQPSWQAMRVYDVCYDLWNLPRVLAHLRQPAQAQSLMTFIAAFWEQRFGALTAAEWRDVRLVQRLAARQIDARSMADATARGRHMTLAQAVALALGD